MNLIIAEESRGIALAAQQDSRTMRTIGFMTLVFLPSTLVAVCTPVKTKIETANMVSNRAFLVQVSSI